MTRCTVLTAAVQAGAAALLLTLVIGCTGGTDGSSTKRARVISSTALPAQALDSALTGSIARPALTIEGDAVNVAIGTATVKATVVGPEVPGQGLPHQSATTTCTWTVTLKGGTVAAPFSAADFSMIDHFGTLYHPTIVPGQPALPVAIEAGQTIIFQLRAVMRVGEGLIRWSPGSHGTVAEWDFIAETD